MIKEFHESKNLIPEIVQGGVNSDNGSFTNSTNRIRTNYISVESGKTYSVNSGNRHLSTGCYYLNGTFKGNIDEIVRGAITGTFTIPVNVNQIAIGFRTADGTTDITPSDIENYILCEGTTTEPYEPYGDTWNTKSYAKSISGARTYTKFPIVLRTTEQSIPTWNVKGNMQQSGTPTPTSPITPSECGIATLNVMPSASQQSIENNGITITCDGKGSYHIFGTSTNAVSIEFDIPTFTIPTCVNSGGLGTMSLFNGQIGSTQGASRIYFKNGTTAIDSWQLIQASRTSTNYTALDNKVCNKIEFTIATGITVDTYVRPMFTNDGQLPSNYEPYGYKLPIVSGNTTTNIYLSEPLRKIGNYADTIAADGTVTRVIKKVVLTGNESGWTMGVSQFGKRFGYALTSPMESTIDMVRSVCSHLPLTYNGGTYANPNTYTIGSNQVINIALDASYTTLDQFLDWLQAQYTAGTPVIVWYTLSSPTTETTTTSAIPTTSGLNTIDVNTLVKPSEMSLTYDGYKLCKRQRYSRTENLFNTFDIVGKVPSINNGELVNYAGSTCTPIAIQDGDITITVTNWSITVYLLLYDVNMSYIGYLRIDNSNHYYGTAITGYANAKYCRVRIESTSGLGDVKIMLNAGSTAKPYQPYLDWK